MKHGPEQRSRAAIRRRGEPRSPSRRGVNTVYPSISWNRIPWEYRSITTLDSDEPLVETTQLFVGSKVGWHPLQPGLAAFEAYPKH